MPPTAPLLPRHAPTRTLKSHLAEAWHTGELLHQVEGVRLAETKSRRPMRKLLTLGKTLFLHKMGLWPLLCEQVNIPRFNQSRSTYVKFWKSLPPRAASSTKQVLL